MVLSLAGAESVPLVALFRVSGCHGAHVFAQLARSGSPSCFGLTRSSARIDLAARAAAILANAPSFSSSFARWGRLGAGNPAITVTPRAVTVSVRVASGLHSSSRRP